MAAQIKKLLEIQPATSIQRRSLNSEKEGKTAEYISSQHSIVILIDSLVSLVL